MGTFRSSADMANEALRLRGPTPAVQGRTSGFVFLSGESTTIKGKASRTHKRKKTEGYREDSRGGTVTHSGPQDTSSPRPPACVPPRHSRGLFQCLPASPPAGCSRLQVPLQVGDGGSQGLRHPHP